MTWFKGNKTVDLAIQVAVDSQADSCAAAATAAAAAAISTAVGVALAAAEDAGDSFHEVGNSGAAKTITYADGPAQRVVLSASAPTLTIAGMTAGKYCRLRLLVKQDATGSRLLPTFSPAAVYGTPGAPVLTVTAAKTDVIDLFSVDGGVTLYAVVVVKGL